MSTRMIAFFTAVTAILLIAGCAPAQTTTPPPPPKPQLTQPRPPAPPPPTPKPKPTQPRAEHPNPPTPTSAPTVAPTQPSPTTAAQPASADRCAAGSTAQSPLYDHQVYLTTSPDGMTFDTPGTLIMDHASVPDLVIGADGALWMYFVNGEPGQHGIFAARQNENGTWDVVDCVKLDGQFNGNAVDPNVTRLPDGRIRLVYYEGSFVGDSAPPPPDSPHPIYSAISDDGINFTVEGLLIEVPGVTDPSMIQLPDGSWLLAMTRDGETLLASGADGETFALTGVTLQQRGIPELASLPDGRIGLYLSQLYISDDGGQTWTAQPAVNVPGGGADPSLTPLPAGGFAFAYKTISGNAPMAAGNQPPPGTPPSPPPAQSPPGGGNSGDAMYRAQALDPLPQEDYLAQVVTATDPQSDWEYQTTLIASLPAGNKYDVGGFSRLFRRADGSGYDVLFGGSFQIRTTENARYEGDVRRLLGNDLTFQTEPERFSEHGGDVAFDTDGEFYYTLNAHPQGWILGKYDSAFNRVQETVVPLPDGHAANDQMLRVWNGRLYLSDLYNPNYASVQPGQPASPDEVLYTHLWIYDTDLNPIADYVLDGSPNINGGTLIPYGDGFAYIAADNFMKNNLYANLYDADGNYLRSILLEENAQWSMGGTVAGDRIYIAYHRGEHGHGDIMLDIFDMDWKRLEQIQITAVGADFNAQRPWVQVYGDTMFVSYDIGRDPKGIIDLQPMMSVYRRR